VEQGPRTHHGFQLVF